MNLKAMLARVQSLEEVRAPVPDERWREEMARSQEGIRRTVENLKLKHPEWFEPGGLWMRAPGEQFRDMYAHAREEEHRHCMP